MLTTHLTVQLWGDCPIVSATRDRWTLLELIAPTPQKNKALDEHFKLDSRMKMCPWWSDFIIVPSGPITSWLVKFRPKITLFVTSSRKIAPQLVFYKQVMHLIFSFAYKNFYLLFTSISEHLLGYITYSFERFCSSNHTKVRKVRKSKTWIRKVNIICGLCAPIEY